MDKKFKSKPHTISAFQFTDKNVKPPEWFTEAVRAGGASVTINPKVQCITIYGEFNTEKAMIGDWVCRVNHGKVFVLDTKRFEESYEAA